MAFPYQLLWERQQTTLGSRKEPHCVGCPTPFAETSMELRSSFESGSKEYMFDVLCLFPTRVKSTPT